MGSWSLKQELADRGMTIEEACKVCRFDYQTMSILVNGGQTLPQLALKVGRGLGLTMEQVQVIGKALTSSVWPKSRKESKIRKLGIEPPAPIDMDPMWYRHIDDAQEKKEQLMQDRRAAAFAARKMEKLGGV